tara:strand:+ start:697 stop:1251 length:555 start_codon:yes stop_codon:yes gene_type:complete
MKTEKKEVWLTFDDGPEKEVSDWILQTLKKNNVKATFFLNGKDIVRNKIIFKKILNERHIVGNHSFSHLDGWKTTLSNYIQDIEKCQELMTGNKLFRPPYGRFSLHQLYKIKKKYRVVLWDVFAFDFKKNISPENIKSNILKNIKPGSIIVLHNNKKSFVNLKLVLEDIIHEIRKEGYSFSVNW